MTDKDLKQLAKELDQANEQVYAVTHARKTAKDAAASAALLNIERFLALDEGFGDAAIAQANARQYAAREAVTAAKIAMAQQELRFPEGTVVVADLPRKSYYDYNYRTAQPTVRVRGVVQVVRPGDKFRCKWGNPQPGEVIVRHLKKDGKPGLDYTRLISTWGESPKSEVQIERWRRQTTVQETKIAKWTVVDSGQGEGKEGKGYDQQTR